MQRVSRQLDALLRELSQVRMLASLPTAFSSRLALDLLHSPVVYVHLCAGTYLEWAVVLVEIGTLGHFDGASSDDPCPYLAFGAFLNDSVEVVVRKCDLPQALSYDCARHNYGYVSSCCSPILRLWKSQDAPVHPTMLPL
jgi:hypothetical protein